MNSYQHFNAEGTLLRKHQLRMLDMLIYLDGVCKANDIKYWLSSGTLLGAVRHKGFIPWDDDLDIEMLADDFVKLEKILMQESEYDLQTYNNDFYYILTFNKLRDKKSEVSLDGGSNKKELFKGVFIDIFCIEPSHWMVAWTFTHLYHKINPLGMKLNSRLGKLLFSCIRSVYFFMLRTSRLLFKWIPGKKYRHILGSVCYNKTRDMNDIFPLGTISFEGHEFPAPHNCDGYLTKIYGNYMKIPKEEDIITHHLDVELY